MHSRSLWLKGEDMNNKLFHNQCKERQRKSTITELIKDNGERVTHQGEIKEEVKSYFEKLYREEEEVSQEDMKRVSDDIPSLIKGEDNEILDLPITEEEVHKVVWSLHPDKEPG